MEFDLSPEQQQIVEVARSVAASLAPGYVDRDVSGQFSWDVPRMLGLRRRQDSAQLTWPAS